MTENERRYFEAGEKLRSVGASFLVSYLYWMKIDLTHTNWKLAKINNPATIIKNKEYWDIWIEAIISKDPSYLEQNKIELSGRDIINMASKLHPLLQQK